MKGLKTYFTFLNKNKMFTLVNMGGLSISLMFVLLIANMVSRQLSIDKEQPDASRIYAFGNEQYIGSHYLVGEILSTQYPEIEDWCAVSNLAYTGIYVLQETRKVFSDNRELWTMKRWNLCKGRGSGMIALSETLERRNDNETMHPTCCAADGGGHAAVLYVRLRQR